MHSQFVRASHRRKTTQNVRLFVKKVTIRLISHESVIFYVDAHEIDMIAVDVALGSTIQGYTFRQEADCDSLLLERVRAGMVVSQNVSEELQEYCEGL